MEPKKLYRDTQNQSIGGVCSGLAEYLNMDVSTVRILMVLVVLFTGVGIIPYIVLWIVLPIKPIGTEGTPFNEENKQQDDDLYEYDEEEKKI